MKKLLCSAALFGVAFSAAPALAQVDVTLGGHTKNYIGYLDQDEATGSDVRPFDMLRESELHVNAEGTADNGLVYGFHVEMEADGGDDDTTIEESYLYLASNLGRLNLGSEDGANYLLQVSAPSADSNVDGLRQYIQPVNYDAAGATAYGVLIDNDGLDYDNDLTGKDEKITYLSPNFSGFQFGLSYTHDVEDINSGGAASNLSGDNGGLYGFNDETTGLGQAYEGAARYEGTFNNVGFSFGGGYTHVESDTAALDDADEWNVGLDTDLGAFGLGAVYTEQEFGVGATNYDSETIVVGADYTTGPFQFGASWLTQDSDVTGLAEEVETDRYTGGVVYTLTQGMTLRGSVSYVDHANVTATGGDVEAVSALGGVQFNF